MPLFHGVIAMFRELQPSPTSCLGIHKAFWCSIQKDLLLGGSEQHGIPSMIQMKGSFPSTGLRVIWSRVEILFS